MKIITEHSKEVKSKIGEGGYLAQMIKININRNVDIFGFYVITLPKNTTATEHYHNHFTEIFYLLTPIRIKINDKEYNLKEKTLIVLEPGDRHEEYADDKEITYLVMKLPDVENDKEFKKGV